MYTSSAFPLRANVAGTGIRQRFLLHRQYDIGGANATRWAWP